MTRSLLDEAELERRVAMQLRRVRRLPGVSGTLVASVDGRAVSHDLTQHSPGAAAAVVASTLALAERLGELTGTPGLQELVVRTTMGYALLHTVDERWVLAVLTDLSVNLARLKLDLRDTIGELAAIAA